VVTCRTGFLGHSVEDAVFGPHLRRVLHPFNEEQVRDSTFGTSYTRAPKQDPTCRILQLCFLLDVLHGFLTPPQPMPCKPLLPLQVSYPPPSPPPPLRLPGPLPCPHQDHGVLDHACALQPGCGGRGHPSAHFVPPASITPTARPGQEPPAPAPPDRVPALPPHRRPHAVSRHPLPGVPGVRGHLVGSNRSQASRGCGVTGGEGGGGRGRGGHGGGWCEWWQGCTQ
jgi:hypothetical protein